MAKTTHDLPSADALMLAINSMARERQEASRKLEAGGLEDDEWEYLSDLVLRLTAALNEMGDLYEPMREGNEGLRPSFAKILAKYE